MHDSILLQRIAGTLQRICDQNRMGKVQELVLDVNTDSHISEEILKEHLIELLPELVDRNTGITIRKAIMGEQEAAIYMLKGEGLEG